MATWIPRFTAAVRRGGKLSLALAVLSLPGSAHAQEQRAISVGTLLPFEVGDLELATDHRLLGLGFRVDPGQDKRFGPTVAAYLMPWALTAGAVVLMGDLGVAGRLQGEHMALLPRATITPIVAGGISGGGVIHVQGSVGIGVEFRSEGSDKGLLLDWTYRGVLGTSGFMMLGVHLIL